MGIKGVSLVELLVATVIVVVVMSSMSLFFPKASKAAFMSRYIATGKNLATGKIQEIKQDPYALVPLTYAGAPSPYTHSFTYPGNPNGPNGCDCSLENPDSYPVLDQLTDNGVTFTRRLCINLVYRNGSNWSSYCPASDGSNDTGLKNIRVRVSWAAGTSAQSIDAESMVNR